MTCLTSAFSERFWAWHWPKAISATLRMTDSSIGVVIIGGGIHGETLSEVNSLMFGTGVGCISFRVYFWSSHGRGGCCCCASCCMPLKCHDWGICGCCMPLASAPVSLCAPCLWISIWICGLGWVWNTGSQLCPFCPLSIVSRSVQVPLVVVRAPRLVFASWLSRGWLFVVGVSSVVVASLFFAPLISSPVGPED